MGGIDTFPRLQDQPQNQIAPSPPCTETCMSKLPCKKVSIDLLYSYTKYNTYQ